MGRKQRGTRGRLSNVAQRRGVATPARGTCTSSWDYDWLWGEVSAWVTLQLADRISLRSLSLNAASGVLRKLAAQGDDVWENDYFDGFREDLLDLWQLLQGRDSVLMSGIAPRPPRLVRAVLVRSADDLRVTSLHHCSVRHWVSLAIRFRMWPTPRGGPCFWLSGFRTARDQHIGEDITDRLVRLPDGTLLWLDGRLVILNCFNSLSHLGAVVRGPWILRRRQGEDIIIERFGDPSQGESLGEYRRLRGRCLLPSVAVDWAYIVSLSRCSGGNLVTEVMRQRSESEDHIETLCLQGVAADRTYEALCSVEADSNHEALMLLWSVDGIGNVPVRIAIYKANMLAEVKSILDVSSHEHKAEPPSVVPSFFGAHAEG